MERPLLNDETQYPDDEVLAKHLGKAKPAWDAFAEDISRALGQGALEWRYYNDGKAWLCKVVHKKKTVCWVSVWDRFFKTAFYFTAKNDKDIEALPIAPDLKEQYRTGAPIGKLKPLVVEVRTKKALEPVSVLVKFKSGIRSAARLGLACTLAVALASAAVLAQQRPGAPVVTDKQRKSLTELAEPWPDAATIAKRKADAENRTLFQSSEPLEFTLKADFKTVLRDRDPSSTTLHPATLVVAGTDGQPLTFQVQIRNRGMLRRKPRTCDFPPLRIEFSKDDKASLKGSPFDGFSHIKLSTHCKGGGDYEQYVVREYLAYRTYNLITPWSLRVRLAKGTYVDDTNGKTIGTKLAFFIERDEDLARRVEGRAAVLPRSSLASHDIDALTQAALFSFLVGNTDYSVFLLHNVILVQREDKKLRAVVYDFDLTGLVNPPYAQPAAIFALNSVKDRLYRGPCRPAEQLEPLLASFRTKKDAILQLYDTQAELTKESRQQMREYVEEFFDIINDKARVRRRLVDVCNKEVW